ncbi:glycosyl hydrolase family 28-related protein [Nucisporomicrobium flavum]|uniref:glycosyl hydrolase family 28-related protein n=1 Tax=Nucisporomicrobium flavum TaxID=2785915 RepID=UPI0018F6B5BA|nr:glycosyl hydrolase family 28-related protein [Nucisporomicrobium flavum]
MKQQLILGVAVLAAAQAGFAGPASADVPDGSGYSLAPTVGAPALTAQDCAADPGCAAVSPPLGAGQDDWPALSAAVASAAARGTSTAPATVLLPAGVYTMKKPLSLPPNVNLRGSGMTATTLLIATGSHAAFGYSFLVRPDDKAAAVANSTNLVSDLAVNGNCKAGAGLTADAVQPAAACDHGAGNNVGGGVSAGDRWTVQHVRFTNLEYFKLWIRGTKGVRAVDNRFDNLGGAGSGDEDNIGGGGNATDTLVSDNQYDGTELGNALDFTNARSLTLRHNTVYTDPRMLGWFNRADNGSIFLEAVTDSEISDNLLHGGHIVLKTNADYSHTGTNKDVTNPARNVVRGNRLVGSYFAGITVGYNDYLDPDGTTGRVDAAVDPADTTNHTLWSGGGNQIVGNVITGADEGGILVYGCYEAAKSVADTIAGNTVENASANGASYSTGCGTFDSAGIGLSIGRGDRIYGNHITGGGLPSTWYGVQIGSRTAKTVPGGTVLTDPSGAYADNDLTAAAVGPYRYGRGTPESPVAEAGTLTADGAKLTWREAYPLANVWVGGYRVYRGGTLVADLPVGSPVVPGNLVTDEGATLETGLGGWTAAGGASVSRVTGAPAPGVGAASLAITATKAGQIGATGPATPVTAGQTYTAVASFQAGAQASGRRVRTGVVWLDAAGTAISSRVFSGNASTVDGPDRWMTSSYAVQAPAGAAYARVLSAVDNCVLGETHLMDRIGLIAGTATEGWTDPSGTPGAAYQVVAYQVGGPVGSEYSIPAPISVS